MNQFQLGKVFAVGFSTWFRNLPAFLFITTVVYAPVIIWGLAAVHGSSEPLEVGRSVATFEAYSPLVTMLITMIAGAAVTYGVVMELQGRHAGVGQCISTGLARFFPVLGTAIVAGLAMIGGTFALIVPGIIVACMLYVVTPVAVIERPGVMGALRRSRELTKGHRGDLFAVLLLAGLVDFAMSYLTTDAMAPKTTDDMVPALRHIMYVSLAQDVVFASVGAVFTAVAYHFLRAEKEGTSAHELARIFE